MFDVDRKSNVIVVLGSLLDRDTRATKIINSLTIQGYAVNLLSWNQGFNSSRSERSEAGVIDREIQMKLRAQWGAAVYLTLPIWWLFVFFWLMVIKWDIAHAIQITSALPAVIAGRIKRKPVIYDLLDVYEDSIAIPIQLRNLLVYIDKVIMRLASAVILADNEEVNEVDGIPNENIVVIYDSPKTTRKLESSHEYGQSFNLFFAGLLIRKKALNLNNAFKSIENLTDVKITIAGYGDLVDEINKWEKKMPSQIKFIGEISHSEVLERSLSADALFILRDPIVRVNKYICGSKVLESMMCGRPIIVNKGTSTSKIVEQVNCGIIVDAHNIKEIKNAILRLKNDKDFCEKLGENGKRAYELHYNWDIMEKRLLNLYEKLLGE